jgi:hypothetical protein
MMCEFRKSRLQIVAARRRMLMFEGLKALAVMTSPLSLHSPFFPPTIDFAKFMRLQCPRWAVRVLRDRLF